MLGVATNPRLTPSDEVLKSVADDLGVGDTFHPTQVGVFFGEPGKTVPDPYFGGVGPDRAGCIFCAQCMTGCPNNAKNTTERNYLHLAEKAGAQIHPMTTVIDVRQSPGGGYEVETVRSGRWVRKQRRTWRADQVVFSAAAIGTQNLLHRLRASGSLPQISPRLGELARTNSEAVLLAASRTRTDLAQGVAGTSSIHPDVNTHIEAFRMGKGSNALLLLNTILVDGDKHRLATWALTSLRHPGALARSFNVRKGTERSLALLVMQDLNNSLTTYLKRGLFGTTMTSRQGKGEPNPNWIPIANEITRRVAAKINGDPRGLYGDIVNVPTTGHFIGGCPIGDSPATGVVDPYQRLYGYPGLHVIDGSAIAANLGANPALTITAQSERAVAFWPNKGEPDPRPELGSTYQRISRSHRAVRSCPKTRRRRFAYQRSTRLPIIMSLDALQPATAATVPTGLKTHTRRRCPN
jgi:cholesterol oxidase